MKKVLISVVLCLSVAASRAQSDGKEVSGFSHPESVIQHGNKLYVSNIGKALEPDKKDGDGFISKVAINGKIEVLRFLPQTGVLNAPKGSAFIGDILYVADIDRIVGFDTRTRKTIFELQVPGTAFLNDLVAVKGKLLASATDNGKIYEIDVQQKTVQALPLDLVPGANGLCYNQGADKLYATGFSRDGKSPNGGVYEIDLEQKKVLPIAGYEGFLDGVAVSGGQLYFSDWKNFDKSGILMTMDIKTHSFKKVMFGDAIAGPADFTISADQHYFIIPVMIESKLLWKKL